MSPRTDTDHAAALAASKASQAQAKRENEKAGHTPGPWVVRKALGGGIYSHITSATLDNIAAFKRTEDAEFVVDCVNRAIGSKPDQEKDGSTEELLSLVARTETWQTAYEVGQMARGQRYEHSSFLHDLRAAIAKATR